MAGSLFEFVQQTAACAQARLPRMRCLAGWEQPGAGILCSRSRQLSSSCSLRWQCTACMQNNAVWISVCLDRSCPPHSDQQFTHPSAAARHVAHESGTACRAAAACVAEDRAAVSRHLALQ